MRRILTSCQFFAWGLASTFLLEPMTVEKLTEFLRKTDSAASSLRASCRVMGGGAEARRLAAESGWPFALVGDGAPIPRFSAPACVGRFYLTTGVPPPDLDLGSVWKRGETF